VVSSTTVTGAAWPGAQDTSSVVEPLGAQTTWQLVLQASASVPPSDALVLSGASWGVAVGSEAPVSGSSWSR